VGTVVVSLPTCSLVLPRVPQRALFECFGGAVVFVAWGVSPVGVRRWGPCGPRLLVAGFPPEVVDDVWDVLFVSGLVVHAPFFDLRF